MASEMADLPSAIDLLRGMDKDERIILHLWGNHGDLSFRRAVVLTPNEVIEVLERRNG
jgi:hypothetical protein